MAEVVGTISGRIDQDAANGATCFGLPGTGGIKASMSNASLAFTVKVWDDNHCTLALSGDITDSVIASLYPVVMACAPSSWTWTWNGSGVNMPSGGVQLASGSITVPNQGNNRGPFTWSLNTGDVNIGSIYNYAASAQGRDGILWLGGTGNYHPDDPVYPVPVPITVPGWMEYLDYYPFAIRKGGTMQSANREGGSTKIRKGGSWRDVKNTQVGGDQSKAFVRKSGQWAKAPKIGANAK